jgi:aldehyde dehydrogenase (NAD+)
MSFTLPSDFHDSYKTVFKTFASGKTKSLQWRKWQLKQTWWMLQDNHDAIVKALQKDLNRHPFESTMTDIKALSDDTLLSIQNLEKWTADEIPDAGFVFGTLGKARIRKEPLGVSLIIGAWNFPVSIMLQPMVAAITAGCCMILKPSELAPAVQQLLVEIVPKYLDNEAIRVVTGGPLEMGHILSHKFNHIFYTGSSKVAKIIAVAAAKHLTPVTLELGGQGPAVVSKSADVDLSAKRIASSKVLNAGQICLSVNHVFCAPEVHDEFVQRLGYWFDEFLGEDKMNPEHMVRIVNERNFDRLEGILSRTDGTIVYGGTTNRDDKYIHPTVVTDIQPTGTMSLLTLLTVDALMSEELFGPILPVIKADVTEAVATINRSPPPLVPSPSKSNM